MKVILVNGSPNEEGCTYTALCEVAKTLIAEGIRAEIFWIGAAPIPGCTGCRACETLGRCIHDDRVNAFAKLAESADGFIFGSPVYYASANGSLISFMDRAFFSAGSGNCDPFRLKPAAAVCVARRAGTTATLDQLNKYFTIAQMPVVSSCYWNMVHGMSPNEVRQDLEGLYVMRTLGKNMAWMLRCREAAERAGVPLPKQDPVVVTNFIR